MSASSSPAAAASSARTSSSGSSATAHDVFAARRADYDLTRADDTERLFADAQPELVFHLAAEVGGIGANRANPGRYWYANLMMGAHVLEQARLHDVEQARRRRHRLRLPEAHAGAVPARTTSGTAIPEETNAPYGVAKKAVLVGAQAYREQYGLEHGLPPAREPVRARATTSTRRTRT